MKNPARVESAMGSAELWQIDAFEQVRRGAGTKKSLTRESQFESNPGSQVTLEHSVSRLTAIVPAEGPIELSFAIFVF